MKTVHAGYEWILPKQNRESIRGMAKALRVPGVVAQLLHARGLDTPEDAKAYLDSHRAPLSDPFELTDMDRAVDRLQRARERSEHVRVFGDYDVDGMAATAILSRGLRRFGIKRVTCRMPDRVADGYGLKPKSVEQAAQDEVDVLVTVDNGINAFDAADTAKRLGVDLIVTDHHNIDGALPEACAVINPQRDDPSSPFAHACGSAVAFKLSWALTGAPADFDIAAVATIADVVPLLRENRTLVDKGLRELAEGTHLGLNALVRKAGISPQGIRAESVAFQLAPRINAVARLGNPDKGLQLFLTDSEEEAGLIASELDAANAERRRIEAEILVEAKQEVEATLADGQRTIVLAREGWHPGVIGIVAARLQNTYRRPAIMISIDEQGRGRCSCRSTPDFNIVEALGKCAHLLVQYGGHRAAAGMTIERKHIDAFRDALEAEAQRTASDAGRPPKLHIDALLALSEIDSDLLRAIDLLEPFGHESPAPVFASFGVQAVPGSLRVLRGGHLKLNLKHGGRAFAAIGFNLAERFAAHELAQEIDIAYRPKFNTWRGETTIQLELKDLRPA
ncbi:MAG: single-stranded-DNA-specific exonuclease RecJ [Candidatus Hydrogenedentes bacterium]|nr:single-stranded-DNA-specific exonuclease RecJ [Candidatus Hydrogenedentota bacterium]